MEMRTEGPVKTRREGAILEVTLDAPKANAISLKTSVTNSDFGGEQAIEAPADATMIPVEALQQSSTTAP